MTCAQTSTLGVYLLGALDPEDRSTFESHLSRCDTCRSELVRLAPLPGLLNQITPADFEVTGELPVLAADAPPVALLEPPEPLPAFEDLPPAPVLAPARQPRKRYWLVAAAAALVVVLTVGGVIGYQAVRDEPSPTQVSEGVLWTGTSPDTGIRADVRLFERSWGTELRVWMHDVPPRRECKLKVVSKAGYREHQGAYTEVAGWWGTDHGPDTEVPGSTSIELANIDNLEFVDNYGNKLVEVHRP
ncbi:MAG TPA: zf-HC2 domain-containing protein [Actinophytocola sp.]|uniref:anti-sigma factor family protein n=1 Tax=Actinophytocola sp. TaxID=1872138 RepID=UPI002DDD2960|nr:zf-HC2 domain-containing protein [Actinophytocola sp.]HEV2783186.1 zf-HC2 domain-containing protein [Actinophytocola sp.]